MIISRTPFRVSFLGGGTDYPGWYRKHGGAVLASTINKYCWISVRYLPPFFEHRYRIVWSQIEDCLTVDDIKHPAAREAIKYLGISKGVEVHHDGDLPARAGIASSSAFTVGMLNALHALRGDSPDQKQIYSESIDLEQNILNETIGCQDQVLCTVGGLNMVVFNRDDTIEIVPVNCSPDRIREFESHLMLFFTGVVRTASTIAETYVPEIDTRESQLMALSGLVYEGIEILESNGPLDRFGELLHDGWQRKRALSGQVSTPYIDEIYAAAMDAGAIGGKLLGAGGGGFILVFAHPEKQAVIRERLGTLLRVPFTLESEGAKIIHNNPDEDMEEASLDREQRKLVSFHDFDLEPDVV
jgi:D-glycero-alpha-D-manno-heptose-7-phosphate kinase